MGHWTLIFVAAAANVALNLALRKLGQGLDLSGGTRPFVVSLLLSPWMWLSFFSGALLLVAFVAAVRVYSLSVTYTAVTALAMVVLTAIGMTLHQEEVSVLRIAGLALIVAGLIVTARAA